MRNKRKAKRILRAFGKESYKARIAYVNSFLPEKSSYVGSISYRHALRRAVIVALILVMIMALAVTAYAAVKHYMNYTKVVHPDNDEYVSNGEYDYDVEASFFTPTYVPERYHLVNEYYDDISRQQIFEYEGENSDRLVIMQCLDREGFHVDNERSESKSIMVGNIEVIVYDFSDELLAVMQYGNNLITIAGIVDEGELEQIIDGMNIPD